MIRSNRKLLRELQEDMRSVIATEGVAMALPRWAVLSPEDLEARHLARFKWFFVIVAIVNIAYCMRLLSRFGEYSR